MASRNPLQISGLIKYFKITEEQLEEECSDEHLETLSQSKRFVWKDWADQLGLSDEQIKDIDGMSLDGSGKAQTALSIWQDINGFLATYEKLAETFLGGGNAKLAGEVCKLLKGTTSSETSDQHPKTKTKCACTPLQLSFLEDLKKELTVFKSFPDSNSLVEDAVRKYVDKFISAKSTSVDHLHEHLQKFYEEFLITDPEILEMAKKITDVPKRPAPPPVAVTLHVVTPPQAAKPPLFSKPVVYHTSVCCHAVNICTHNDYSTFFKDEVGHSFKEVSISRSEEGRYLIAVQDSTYYIAFQSEPNIAQWPERYQSFSEGISSQCKVFPINFILELLRSEKNRVVLTGFSLGGLLACSVHAKIWNSPNVSPRIKENLVCITFGQPHVPIPGLEDLTEDYPNIENTVHAIQYEKDLVPRLLGLLHKPHETFEENCQKFKLLIGQGYSQTSLTDELVQEVCEMSSGIELAKAIPAIEQPLTYHLLFAGSDGLLPEMTYEDISGHHSYQLDNIRSNLENHSMDVYSKRIIRGYLNKDPKYEIPPNQSKPPQPVQALKPDVTSVDLINHGSELDLAVEGSKLWFYNTLSLYNRPIEPAPFIVQSKGTSLHLKISGESNSDWRSLKDRQKVTIGFHTHFSTHWAMDIECHTKAYAMNCRQEQLAKLTPSDVIELSYLNALLEYKPHYSTQPHSDKVIAIKKFFEKVVKVVPLESIGYSVAYGDSYVRQQCAKALDTLHELGPSKMMIDALTKAKRSCGLCDSCPSADKEPETGLPAKPAPSPAGNCLCPLITQLLDRMGELEESTGIICGLDVKALYPITSSIQGLKSPIETLQHGRSRLSSLSADEGNNNDMLKTVNDIRKQDLAVCISLLGAFMDQQEIDIPLSRFGVKHFSVAAKATVGVWAISNLDLEHVQTIVEESPGEELVVNVNVEDYIVDEDQRVSGDGQYAAKLHFIVQGLQKTVTCNTQCISYSLERQLADLCKDKPDIHPDRLQNLILEWDQIFEKNILSLVAETHRPMIARWLNWSLMVHKLREELAKYTTIGVVGLANSGMSTLAKTLFKLDMIYSGTTEEKRTTVPFIYNLKRKLEGLNEGLDIDIVDFPGVDDRDESVSDLTPLLLHLVHIVIFVVNYKVAHTGACKKWLDKLRGSKTPLLVCLTYCDKLYAEVKYEVGTDPTEKQMKDKFQLLSKHLQLPVDQKVMFCSFKQDADSILNNGEGRKKLGDVGIDLPKDVGDWVVDTFRMSFKQRDLAARLKYFFSSDILNEIDNHLHPLLTQLEVKVLKQVLRDEDSHLSLEDVGISSEPLASDTTEEVSTSLVIVQNLLRQKGLGHIAGNYKATLDEILEEQQRNRERLERLMTDQNTINLRCIKLFLVGPPFVGKTTTLERLRKEIENLHSLGNKAKTRSTLLANFSQVLAFVSGTDCEWKSSSNLDEEARLLFNYMCSADVSGQTKKETTKSLEKSLERKQPTLASTDDEPGKVPRKQPSVASSEEKPVKVPTKPPSVTSSNTKPGKLPSTQSSVTSSPEPRLKASDQKRKSIPFPKVDKIMSNMKGFIKSGDFSGFRKLIEKSILLSISDVGGQPGFLEMLPALLNGPALYLLFFNMCKALNKRYKIPFSRDNTTITPYDAVHTVESVISQILSAISSVHCTPRVSAPFAVGKDSAFSKQLEKFQSTKSAATVLATHMDKLEGDAVTVARKIKEVNEALKKTTDRFSNILVNPSEDRSFFPVDNFNGTEESDIAPIRTHLNKIFDTHFPNATLPVRPAWLMFSIILRKEYHIISIEESFEIGKRLIMDEEEVKFALQYIHHCIGTLMYYPGVPNDQDKWFEGHIICSPQVVFDSISQMIVASLRTLHSGVAVRACEQNDWLMKGLFSLESIKKYCQCEEITQKVSSDKLIPVEQLVKLLDHVNLLTFITSSEDEVEKYFLPAILESATEEELAIAPQPDANTPSPLLLTFKFEYVPTGVFCGLITRISSRGSAGMFGMTWGLKEEGVKRNQISFLVGKVNTVTLLAHSMCYEIRVVRGDGKPVWSLHDLCSLALSTVLTILKDLHKDLEPRIAFDCPCKKHPQSSTRDLSNLCVLVEEDVSSRFVCGESVVDSELKESQMVWIGKHATEGKSVCLEVMKASPDATLKTFSFNWIMEGTNQPPVSSADQPNVLTIQSVTEDHYGHYKCEVKKDGELHFTAHKKLQKRNLKFSSNMTCEELCDWLKQNKICGRDLQIFEDQRVYGEIFLSLPSKKADFNNELCCSLTLGGWMRLSRLMEEAKILHKESQGPSEPVSQPGPTSSCHPQEVPSSYKNPTPSMPCLAEPVVGIQGLQTVSGASPYDTDQILVNLDTQTSDEGDPVQFVKQNNAQTTVQSEVSEFEFSVDMTTDVLCDWLKINKLKDKYIAILSEEDIDGDSFVRLPRDKDALKRDFPDLKVGGALKVTALIEKALSTIDNNKKRDLHAYVPRYDFKKLRGALWEVRAQWESLGVELDVDEGTREAIKRNYPTNVVGGFTELLTAWTKLSPPPSLDTIVTALRSNAISRHDIAIKIEAMIEKGELL